MTLTAETPMPICNEEVAPVFSAADRRAIDEACAEIIETLNRKFGVQT